MRKKTLWADDSRGFMYILETLTAISITIALLVVFFLSTSNLYKTYEREDVDLQARCMDVAELLLSNPGLGDVFNLNWEIDPVNASVLSLAVSPTLSYGVLYVDEQGGVSMLSHHDFFNYSGVNLFGSCFVGGTLVLMADGSYRPIERICVGDMVKSYDEETGCIVDRRVAAVFHHSADEMNADYYLLINGFLGVTPNHMLYTGDKWVSAADVHVGSTINGMYVYSVKKMYECVPTFDLGVEDTHNYLVLCGPGLGFWVAHNTFPLGDSLRYPWTAVKKTVYPSSNGSFSPYGGDYYVEYIDMGDGYYFYEVKSRKMVSYSVLDFDKIVGFTRNEYDDIRSRMRLNESGMMYDFFVEVRNESGCLLAFGINKSGVSVSVRRNVLIYHPPYVKSLTEMNEPYYEQGQITVTVFKPRVVSGGEYREYGWSWPPNIYNPYPSSGVTDIHPPDSLGISVFDMDPNPRINISWYWYNFSSQMWELFGRNDSVGNGRYYQPNHNFSENGRYYVWSVNLTDGTYWVNKTYNFTTTDWFDEDWHCRKLITINHIFVYEDLFNFPVLVNITDADLRDKAQSDGDDIVFVLYSDNITKLNHEIELYNASNGRLVAWVNVTHLYHDRNTRIWMYYNNSECENQQNKYDTWDSHYVMVQHMDEEYYIYRDSTRYRNFGHKNGHV
ncbi:MAG: hypothetical protein DRN08_04075, partial [Thermoplasmata archaeon]